jgi:hypothetical protein
MRAAVGMEAGVIRTACRMALRIAERIVCPVARQIAYRIAS